MAFPSSLLYRLSSPVGEMRSIRGLRRTNEVSEYPDLVSWRDDGIPVAGDPLMHFVDAGSVDRVLMENARVVEVQIPREPDHGE